VLLALVFKCEEKAREEGVELDSTGRRWRTQIRVNEILFDLLTRKELLRQK